MSTPDLFGDVNQSVVVIEETLSRPLSLAQRKYNALLDKINKQKAALEQWQQLKTETHQIEINYKQMLELSPWERLTPKKLHFFLKSDMAQLEQKIKDIQHDRHLFERDIQALKAWLTYLH